MALIIRNGSKDPRKEELRRLFKENTYTRKVWKTSKEDVYTINDPIILELVPELVNIVGDAKVITKTVNKKDSDGEETGDFYTFKKVLIPLADGEKEMELSKKPSLWMDGDEMPLKDLRICIERYQKDAHLYVDTIDNIQIVE